MRLRREPALLESAIEEVLRFASPCSSTRAAPREVELEGAAGSRTTTCSCWLGSANRDETVFERADVLRPPPAPEPAPRVRLRQPLLPRQLARLEARVAVSALLSRTRSLEPAWSSELPLHPSPVFRGVTRLPVRLA